LDELDIVASDRGTSIVWCKPSYLYVWTIYWSLRCWWFVRDLPSKNRDLIRVVTVTNWIKRLYFECVGCSLGYWTRHSVWIGGNFLN
jgi:preprotein translocase subunit Sec63